MLSVCVCVGGGVINFLSPIWEVGGSKISGEIGGVV